MKQKVTKEKRPVGRPSKWSDLYQTTTMGDAEKDFRLKGKFSVGDRVRIRDDISLADVDNIREMYAHRGKEATVVGIVYGIFVKLDVDELPWIWWPNMLQKAKGEQPV